MRALGKVSALAMLALASVAARAGELVVIESHGIRLDPGKTIDGSKPLSLLDGQTVTMLTAAGQIVKLEGPSEAAPESGVKAGASTDVQTAMAALITERRVRTSEVGVVRGDDDVKLPDPWVVDVSHPGTSCVQAGKPVVLWRGQDLRETRVDFAPKDRSWNVSGTWPASADRLAMPASMPLRDNWDYIVSLGDKLAPVTVRLSPPAVNNDAMRAGYMIEAGCDTQLNALLAAWRK
jgi:hypothetical protein